jgi:transposase-like protein
MPPSPLFTALRRGGKNLLGILASRFWLRGAATRAVAAELNSTFGSKLSSSDVSRLTATIIPDVEQWLSRPVSTEISYLFLDALYLPVRKSEFTTKQALLVAIGLTPDGTRHVLGFILGDRENTDSWTALLKDLLARGLDRNKLLMVISDDHKAIDAAVAQTLAVPHQFCVIHKMRNALVRVAAKHRKTFLQDFKAIFWADSRDAAFLALGQLQERWQRLYPKATQIVLREPERFLRFFDQPAPLWTTAAIAASTAIPSVSSTRSFIGGGHRFESDAGVRSFHFLSASSD